MQQPVDSAEIDERAVVGNILHGAFEDHALFEHLERLFLERCALALEHAAPRDHHVAARAIELQDSEAAALSHVSVQIARRTNIDMRPRQERRHPDIDFQSAFDFAEHHALDRRLRLKRLVEFAPDFELLGLRVRKHHRAVFGLGAFEVHVNLVALPDRRMPFMVKKFGERDLPFALVVDVDDDAVARDQKHSSNQHIAGTGSLQTLFHQRLKVIFSSAHLFRQRFLHLVGPSGTSGLCNPYNRARLVSSPWRR